MRNHVAVALTVCLSFVSAAVNADEDANRAALVAQLERVMQDGPAIPDVPEIAARDLIIEVYERRGFALNWTDPEKIEQLLFAIRATEADGLDPADYHLDFVEGIARERRSGAPQSPGRLALADIILTDSLARLGYHQRFGKVNPYTLDSIWNFNRDLGDDDPPTAIQDIIDADSLNERLASVFPRGWFYQRLQDGLAKYRNISTNGGWPLVAEGPTLRPGQSDDRVATIAQRLRATGDLEVDAPPDSGGVYGDTLRSAVRRFQERHGLDADGIIGPATISAMNVSAETRVRQLEINLERARWVLDDITDDFVLVNIAGFRVYLVRNREVIWESRVQVGRTYRQSPVFKDRIRYLDFNPTWTVPWSIATRDLLPQIKSDPGFFIERGFDLKNSAGDSVDPASVDWSTVTRNNFPYTLVQRPGPNNALGRVKFMFPNKYAIYLHDTPSKSLFGRAERTFSSGCIRVEHPFDFAEQLLGDDGWTQQRFQQVLDSGKTTTVFLKQPMPVLLLYWTVEVDDDGRVRFYRDVYGRDSRIAEELAQPFTLDLPET